MFTFNYNSFKKTPYCANIYRPPLIEHKHDYFEIAFPVKNSCVNVVNECEIAFSVGTCCLLRPNDKHYFTKVPKCPFGEYTHKDVYVNIDKMKRICDAINPELYEKIISAPDPVTFNLPSSLLRLLIRQTNLIQSIDKEKPTESDALHTTVVASILSCYIEDNLYPSTENQIPGWLKSLLNKLSSLEYMVMPIKDIAKETGYAPEHISREFHKYMGVSLNKYITKKKMEYASAVLSQNSVKIIDVAQMLGYSNPSNFSKNFYSEFQISPNKYYEKITSNEE